MSYTNPLSPDAEVNEATTDSRAANEGGLDRRGFLRRATLTGAAGLLPAAGLLSGAKPASADDGYHDGHHEDPNRVTRGDVAILRFLAAAEQIEEDLWQQYAELATNNPAYQDAVSEIDDAIPQYSRDTTADEHSHAAFINGFLRAIGAEPVNLNSFRTIMPPNVQGIAQTGRLTNLTNLTVDTSWYNRYRSAENPDFGDTIPQLLNIVNRTAIPTSNSMTTLQLQTAARVAGFHFPSIEQGGTSLYPALMSKVTNLDVLRILASIGPVEAVHYSIFHDALEDIEPFDSGDGFVIPTIDDDTRHAVMPKPCTFLSTHLPPCAVVRPTSIRNAGARAAATAFIGMNLFQGQSKQFFRVLQQLAAEADAAERRL